MTRPGEDSRWTYMALWFLYAPVIVFTRIERRIRRWLP